MFEIDTMLVWFNTYLLLESLIFISFKNPRENELILSYFISQGAGATQELSDGVNYLRMAAVWQHLNGRHSTPSE